MDGAQETAVRRGDWTRPGLSWLIGRFIDSEGCNFRAKVKTFFEVTRASCLFGAPSPSFGLMKFLQFSVLSLCLASGGSNGQSQAAIAPGGEEARAIWPRQAVKSEDRPTRIRFSGVELDSKDPNASTFQITSVYPKRPSQFLKLGEILANTKLRLEKYVFKEVDDPKTGAKVDVSELTFVDTETHKAVVLVKGKITDLP
jgi:hypothetical protein